MAHTDSHEGSDRLTLSGGRTDSAGPSDGREEGLLTTASASATGEAIERLLAGLERSYERVRAGLRAAPPAAVTAEVSPAAGARPFVTLAYAQSIDGSIAAEPGRPTALSGPESLRMTHALRAAHDAILVGIGTVLADDPQLTVRLVDGRSPRPVVVDSRLRLPAHARLLAAHRHHGGRPPLIATTATCDDVSRRRLESEGARVVRLPADGPHGWVDLGELLRQLAVQGVRRLMVEGGAKVITSFLRARLIDYAVITVAPRLVGGLSAFGGLDGGALPRFGALSSLRLGEDLVLSGELRWPAAAAG
jgi:GTP cyclohydrolase II